MRSDILNKDDAAILRHLIGKKPMTRLQIIEAMREIGFGNTEHRVYMLKKAGLIANASDCQTRSGMWHIIQAGLDALQRNDAAIERQEAQRQAAEEAEEAGPASLHEFPTYSHRTGCSDAPVFVTLRRVSIQEARG